MHFKEPKGEEVQMAIPEMKSLAHHHHHHTPCKVESVAIEFRTARLHHVALPNCATALQLGQAWGSKEGLSEGLKIYKLRYVRY